MTALVIAEHDHGLLKGATFNTVTVASAGRLEADLSTAVPELVSLLL
jgi:hypothetical protein